MNYSRKTLETDIQITLSETDQLIAVEGLPPFLTHLVTLFIFYSGFGATIKITDDGLEDFHHAFEDLGIALGNAFKGIQKNRAPVRRYTTQYRPMDEALVRASLDLSGRCGFYPSWDIAPLKDTTSEAIAEFYIALCRSLLCTLHLDILKGQNSHHIHEACFKALGSAVSEALMPAQRLQSTKGVIDQ